MPPETNRVDVLLVEDDEDARELMAEVLELEGFGVSAVAGGPEALRILAERTVHVLVTDLGMPGMGGMELVRAARAAAPGVPVVVVTGWTEREDVDRARGREIDVVVTKPVDPARLVRAVRSAVAGRSGAAPP